MPGGWDLGKGITWNYKMYTITYAGYAVKHYDDETMQHATAGTDAVMGIALNALTAAQVAEGRRADIKLHGPCWAVASAAITRGASVTATTAGKLVSTTTDGDSAVGYAMTSAAADGDKFMLFVCRHDVYVA